MTQHRTPAGSANIPVYRQAKDARGILGPVAHEPIGAARLLPVASRRAAQS